MPKAHKGLSQLINRYRAHEKSLLKSAYNEDSVRAEFLDPLFKLLGWDLDNASGATEKLKDVERGPSLRRAHGTRAREYAPDYAFRLGGVRKFFVEAKKPSVKIRTEKRHAYQLRRYVWNNKVPVGVLTNFRDFVVYDCRFPPQETDPVSEGLRLAFSVEDYERDWEKIHSLFSKQAAELGLFDRFVDETPDDSPGVATVDESFLNTLAAMRKTLAAELAKRNPQLGLADLRYSVQAILDRIIFLRICEDRGAETYGHLRRLSQGNTNVYAKLLEAFDLAATTYNSSLFRFGRHADPGETHDEITPYLKVTDRVLQNLIESLYPPRSPYDYALIPSDVLGQAYEQFLGEVIDLQPRRKVSIKPRPDVTHAGGVYYTPSSITRHIVQQTVGAALANADLSEANKIRILDPACGSGSFLIAAYEYLLDWYLTKYVEKFPIAQQQKRIDKNEQREWILTNAERKRILLQSIYGVDVDRQAVEVTKLSLLLKVVEDARIQRRIIHEPALPALDRNITQGNSIISPERLAAANLSASDFAELTPFSWRSAFPEIMQASNPGFTVIIGNPPYVNAWNMFQSQPQMRALIKKHKLFATSQKHWDLYIPFLETALGLMQRNGRLSFIIPYPFARESYGEAARAMLLRDTTIDSIVDLRAIQVFKRTPIITMIPFIRNKRASRTHRIMIDGPGRDASQRSPGTICRRSVIAQSVWRGLHQSQWRLEMTPIVASVCGKINDISIRLGDICHIRYGAQMSSKPKAAKKFGKKTVLTTEKSSSLCYPTIAGRNVYRYRVAWGGKYVDWSYRDQMYGAPDERLFKQHKLFIRDLTGTHRLEIASDRRGLFSDHGNLICVRAFDVANWCSQPPLNSSYGVEAAAKSEAFDLDLLQGLLASKLVSAYSYWLISGEGVRKKGGFHTYPRYAQRLPVFDVPRANSSQRRLLTSISKAARELTFLHQKMIEDKDESQASNCAALDQQIDEMVYQLYGLSADEIAAVNDAL